uniref:Ubiquitin recognition factor in ER associated degradation 1 n=1 Tax=Sarcophilus harrisii TaxID=9305 RepID=A0A7N4V0Y3_SARHA
MFSFNMFDHPIPRVFQNRFSTQYRCFSVSMLAGPNDSNLQKVPVVHLGTCTTSYKEKRLLPQFMNNAVINF